MWRTNRWPKFPVLRAGPEAWNRRVQVGKTLVEFLDELYFAENKGWGFKSRCLMWIGPYFPGSDPASRERIALEQANHESNVKVVVLGEDPAARQLTTALMKGEIPWTVTTFDYVAGRWTLTGVREPCTGPPAWNQEPRLRIMIFAPGDALTEEVDDDDLAADAGDGDGQQPDDPKDDEPGDGVPPDEPEDETHDEAGDATEYPGQEGSAMLGVELRTDGSEPPVQESPKRQISEEVVVGPFQLSNDVGDHPACVSDASQDFDKQLTVQPPGQEIVLSPSSEVEDDDVVVERCGPPAVEGAEKARLLSEGHQVIPSKWVDTIKNIHEINGPDFKPIYKARLVSCGNFESGNKEEIRCDTPTSEPRVTSGAV